MHGAEEKAAVGDTEDSELEVAGGIHGPGVGLVIPVSDYLLEYVGRAHVHVVTCV